MTRTWSRLTIAILAIATAATGTWYFVERHQSSRASTDAAVKEAAISDEQVTLIRLQKELGGLRNVTGSGQVHAVPDTPAQPDLLREFQAIAGVAHVSVQAITFDAAGGKQSAGGAQSTKGNTVPVTIGLFGSRDALLSFLGKLQSSPRFVVVTDVQWKSGDGGDKTVLNLQLSFPY